MLTESAFNIRYNLGADNFLRSLLRKQIGYRKSHVVYDGGVTGKPPKEDLQNDYTNCSIARRAGDL